MHKIYAFSLQGSHFKHTWMKIYQYKCSVKDLQNLKFENFARKLQDDEGDVLKYTRLSI